MSANHYRGMMIDKLIGIIDDIQTKMQKRVFQFLVSNGQIQQTLRYVFEDQ